MLATEVRQEELEKEYWMEKLREVCREKDINIELLNYPLKKCVAYIKNLSLIIIASNYKDKQIRVITDFIRYNCVNKN